MPTLEAIDYSTKFWFQTHWTPLGDAFMLDVTALGGYSVLSMITLFAFGLLLALGRTRTACFLLAAVIGGVVLVEGSKALLERERPDIYHPLVRVPGSYSFPSGHSMASAVVYLTLALVAAPHLPRRRVRIYVIGCSLILVLLIGTSRLYLGVHYLTDVLAGWVGGLAWALACRWVEDSWRPLRQEENITHTEEASMVCTG